MIALKCPIPECLYETPESSETVACALLAAHTPLHMTTALIPAVQHAGKMSVSHGPKLDRPKVDVGINQEEWNIFARRWDAFVAGSGIDGDNCSSQLFQCAGDTLGNSLLKTDPAIISKSTGDVMKAMKSLAVIAVATGVSRAELVQMHQERDESFRSFAARVRGKAEICNYIVKCSCLKDVDFTDSIIRDVLIAGIADMDIRREILGTDVILERSVNDVISLVESKEMARNAMPTASASISFTKQNKIPTIDKHPNRNQTGTCPDCSKRFALFSEGMRGYNTRAHRQCIDCYRKKHSKRNALQNSTKQAEKVDSKITSEVGAVFTQISSVGTEVRGSQASSKGRYKKRHQHLNTAGSEKQGSRANAPHPGKVNPSHHIFTKGEWRRARFLSHPEVKLMMSVHSSDYRTFGYRCPTITPTSITAMADSGAQSCLWSMDGFLASGFTHDDLIPVAMDLVAANKSPITIAGAIIIRLQGKSQSGEEISCATMVYVSKQARGFYLSCETMMDLGIVSHDFPSVGAATDSPSSQSPSTGRIIGSRTLNAGCSAPDGTGPCSCPVRTVVPDLPKELPFECTPANNSRMEEWLLNEFAASTFNTCPHRALPCMTGPPVEIHLKDDVHPKAVHTPAPIPVHWQEQVHADLLRDEALGVIEQVPYGEPVSWCHRMVVTRKHDGSPRRTVDLSPLNKHCKRETFASESPFHLARRVPTGTWKTVSDAWNGYHSVPLRESDRHLTTFITPFGRWRYTRAPQGFLSSGDGYNRRFDAILSDFECKERCVDDTIHYDTDLEMHWWRTIQFLIRVGQSGIVLNPDKFRFARKTVDFAGFRISDTTIEPLPKYLDAIRDFPTPTCLTDIRSWFGLVNQVSNYAQLRDMMAPFKPYLSPKCKFEWTPELDTAFNASKISIVEAIRHGVEIFDQHKRTCLRTDWSERGIGYILSQKCCSCESHLPECCTDGWRITLAGSRFLTSTEQRYAAIEGEALAIAWGLEQTKYFTQGCDNLVVVTDHKPLVKIMGDRTLDEISNTRIFRLKQRTLPWFFEIFHMPGKTNPAADATSRYPSPNNTENYDDECAMAAAIHHESKQLTSISWENIAAATSEDPAMCQLLKAIKEGFPDTKRATNPEVSVYWMYRESLYISDGVIMYMDRVVIPPTLRSRVLQILHSAHQGVSSMEARARAIIFWPGMTTDIQSTRDNCSPCNANAPSQAATPCIPSSVPSTPFESIYADFFEKGGCHYLVAGDRLSGWVEIFMAPHGTNQAGAQGLISSLRTMFRSFGIPEEIASDGGPEFIASKTEAFLACWGIRHRISSAHFPQSNGRAEVAVKKCKRILMNNIGPTGSLDNDRLLCAMLQVHNTPDPDCGISPAEILFGRPIRDAFSFINRRDKFTNPSLRPTWREAWTMKEDAMRTRFSRSSEALDAHARPLLPLTLGDRVFVQNQHGHHPTKWDKSGTIVELGEHDQYWVKVDGSGRLTLRNRRFLRKFTQPSMAINKPLNITAPSQLPLSSFSPQLPRLQESVVRPQRTRTDNTSPELPEPVVCPQRPRTDDTTASPGLREPVVRPQRSRTDDNTASPRLQESEVCPQRSRADDTSTSPRLQEPEVHLQRSELQNSDPSSMQLPTTGQLPVSNLPATSSSRPQREHRPRKIYIPETGKWE